MQDRCHPRWIEGLMYWPRDVWYRNVTGVCNGHSDQFVWTYHDVDSHHKACSAVTWRRSPRSIWRRRWPGPRWTPLQTCRLFSEQPPPSPSHNPQGQGQTSWGCPFSEARGCLSSLWRTWYVTNSRTVLKHTTQFVQQHEWLGYIILMPQVTIDTAMGNFSQGNITTVLVCGGCFVVVRFAETSSGSWRSLTSLLQERINPSESMQYKINRGPAPLKGFCERPVLTVRGAGRYNSSKDPGSILVRHCTMFPHPAWGPDWASSLSDNKHVGLVSFRARK